VEKGHFDRKGYVELTLSKEKPEAGERKKKPRREGNKPPRGKRVTSSQTTLSGIRRRCERGGMNSNFRVYGGGKTGSKRVKKTRDGGSVNDSLGLW